MSAGGEEEDDSDEEQQEQGDDQGNAIQDDATTEPCDMNNADSNSSGSNNSGTSSASGSIGSSSATAGVSAPAKKVPRIRNQAADGNSGKQPSTSSSNAVTEKKTSSAIPPHSYYVGKSNGWRLVKNALDNRGWQQLPFEYKFSSRFALKWVERRCDIDYRAHMPGQLVCHIPNNDCITTKNGLLTSLRIYQLTKQQAASSAKSATGKPLFSPVKKPSAGGAVRAISSPSKRSLSVDMGRTATSPLKSKGGRDSLSRVSIVTSGHNVRNSAEGTIEASVGATAAANVVEPPLVSSCTNDLDDVTVPWLPTTYSLDSPADCTTVVRLEEKTLAEHSASDGKPNSDKNTSCIWIYKPSACNRGRGIKVVKGLQEIKTLCYGHRTDDPDTTIAPARGILQRYIENPLLVPAPPSLPKFTASDVVMPVDNSQGDGATDDNVNLTACVNSACDSSVSVSVNEALPAAAVTTVPSPIPVPVSVPAAAVTGSTSSDAPLTSSTVSGASISDVTMPVGPMEGHKFDIRCYLLIARNDPTYLALYHPGYCRLSLSPYSTDESKLNDPSVHLTNAAIQRKTELYESMKDFQVSEELSITFYSLW